MELFTPTKFFSHHVIFGHTSKILFTPWHLCIYTLFFIHTIPTCFTPSLPLHSVHQKCEEMSSEDSSSQSCVHNNPPHDDDDVCFSHSLTQLD